MRKDMLSEVGLNGSLCTALRRAQARPKRWLLFLESRWTMWAGVAMGLAMTAGTYNWLALAWCLVGTLWWRYSCWLEDQYEDMCAERRALTDTPQQA